MSVSMLTMLAESSQPRALDPIKPLASGLMHSLLAFWPLWLLVGLVGLTKLGYQLYRLRRLSRSGIAEIDTMDGRTFEVFLSTLFRRLGYSVEVTKYRGDYGADLVVKRAGRKTVVQAKRWKKRVGLKAVQEAVAAKAMYGCDAALVVANREFTQQARRLNKVELWDREALVGKLLAVRGEQAREAPEPLLLDGAPAEPPAVARAEAVPVGGPAPPGISATHCTTCGAAVSAKVRDYCLARPARFGGRVYCFNHQRQVRSALAD
jgi:restriction system protein